MTTQTQERERATPKEVYERLSQRLDSILNSIDGRLEALSHKDLIPYVDEIQKIRFEFLRNYDHLCDEGLEDRLHGKLNLTARWMQDEWDYIAVKGKSEREQQK